MISQLRLALLLLKCKSMSARHDMNVYFYYENNVAWISVIRFVDGREPFEIASYAPINSQNIRKLNKALNYIKKEECT